MDCIKNYAVDDRSAYYFKKLSSLDYLKIMKGSKVKYYWAADDFLALILDLKLTHGASHTRLLVILKGNRITEFQQAHCLISRLH